MSSIILPKLKVTKSITALVGFIFTVLLIIFSFLGILPNLTNSGAVFGMIFFTVISTTIVNSIIGINWIGRIQELVLRALKVFNPSGIWFSGQIDGIRNNREFKELRDGPISEFLLGTTLIAIAILFSLENMNLFSIFLIPPSTNIEKDQVQLPLYFNGIIFLVILFLGIIILILSFYRTYKQQTKMLTLVWYYNFRYLQKDEIPFIKEINHYLRSIPDWEGFQTEFYVRVLNPICRQLSKYLKMLHNISLSTATNSYFPAFFDSFANSPTAGTQWVDFSQRQFSDISIFRWEDQKIQNLSIHGIIFGVNRNPETLTFEERDKLNIKKLVELFKVIRKIDSIILNLGALIYYNKQKGASGGKIILKSSPPHESIPSEIYLDDTTPNDRNYFFVASIVGLWLLNSEYHKELMFRDYDTIIKVDVKFIPDSIIKEISVGYGFDDKAILEKLLGANVKLKQNWIREYKKKVKGCVNSPIEKSHIEKVNHLRNEDKVRKIITILKSVRKTIIADIKGEIDQQKENIENLLNDSTIKGFK